MAKLGLLYGERVTEAGGPSRVLLRRVKLRDGHELHVLVEFHGGLPVVGVVDQDGLHRAGHSRPQHPLPLRVVGLRSYINASAPRTRPHPR